MKTLKNILIFTFFSCFFSCSEETIDTYATGSITGKVVSKGNYEPLENVKISTNPASSTIFTNEEGEFELYDVPQGEYSVQAQKDGLLSQFEGASVYPNAEVNVIFEMEPETATNRQPTAPKAISPEDKAINLGIAIEFAWQSTDPDEDEITYALEIRNDENNEILNFENINDTTYTVNSREYGRKYFWQITALDSINDPVLSEVFSFETAGLPSARYFYVKKIDGNNVIFGIDGDGNEYQLTPTSENSFRPRKNIATGKVAFLKTTGGETHLFTMDPDGSNQFQVTRSVPVNGFNLNYVGFSWAENGASLVYPNFDKLYQIDANGGGNKLIYQTSGKFITNIDVGNDDSMIAVLANNASGYNAEIFTIDLEGNRMQTVLENIDGAVNGVNLSVDKHYLLFSRDISGYENGDYRRLNNHLFIYDFEENEFNDLSGSKVEGTNDFEARFSPNEASVIFTNTSNDGVSQNDIYQINLTEEFSNIGTRSLLFENASMPDWE